MAPLPSASPAPAMPAAASGDVLPQMPGRYRVTMPPAALLSYTITRSKPGQASAAAGSGLIAWETDGNLYRMQVDGILGQLTSEGGSDDAGIAPQLAHARHSSDTLAATRFDRADKRIVTEASGRTFPMPLGSQDRASMLMQMAGMGLAEPDQFQDVLEFYVGGTLDAAVQRFQVLGRENVDTGVGTLLCWRLAQLARPGEPRLEVWLAPERGWYPVQLRISELDGAVSTQVLTAIGTPATPP